MHSRDPRSWSFKEKETTNNKSIWYKNYDLAGSRRKASWFMWQTSTEQPSSETWKKVKHSSIVYAAKITATSMQNSSTRKNKIKWMRFSPLSWTQRQTDVDKKMLQTVLLLLSRAQLTAIGAHLSLPAIPSTLGGAQAAANVWCCVLFHILFQHKGFNYSLLYVTLTVASSY